MKMKIAPSILSADFGNLNADIAQVEPYCDLIHVDVMDGHFVPNITLGAPVVAMIRSMKPLDVHLMIENPGDYVDDFAKAGASIITVHAEAEKDLKSLIKKIKNFGLKAGISVRPKTGVEAMKEVLDLVDMVLIMTVEPGFGGQKFMTEMLEKVKEVRALRSDVDIEVDGGINAETAKLAAQAGANVFVAGSFIFNTEDRKAAIDQLREAIG
jgi:ribulose-phosphate 3-epimerase